MDHIFSRLFGPLSEGDRNQAAPFPYAAGNASSPALSVPYWVDALLPDNASTFPGLLDVRKTFYYCFPATPPSHFLANDRAGFMPLTADQRQFATQAFSYISSMIDLKFVETVDPAGPNTIVIANNLQAESGGYAYYPSEWPNANDVLIDYGHDAANLHPQDGTYVAFILMHELGHALGLKHPFEPAHVVGENRERAVLGDGEDASQWSVMSYAIHAGEYHLRYSPFDIAALQYLYGPSTAQRDDTIHQLAPDRPNFIWDGGGNDTIDASALTQSITLYLDPGAWGHVGPRSAHISAPGQVSINAGTLIENANGGIADDTIIGNAAGNRLAGGAGNDLLDGAAGIDTAVLHGARSQFIVASTVTGYTSIDQWGQEGCDTLLNVERIAFDDGALALDMDGHAGQAYRLYGLFNRPPDPEGLGYWIARLDRGMPLLDVAACFLDAAESHAHLGKHPSNTDLVRHFYQNILHRAPDPDEFHVWLNALATGQASPAEVLIGFTESTENQAQVIAAIQHGMEYLLFV